MGRPLTRAVLLLAALLLAVGWLQFRWIGELSRADSERLQRALEQESAAFVIGFDREVAQLMTHFLGGGGRRGPGGSASAADSSERHLAERIRRRKAAWEESGNEIELLESVDVVRHPFDEEVQWLELGPEGLTEAPLPTVLGFLREAQGDELQRLATARALLLPAESNGRGVLGPRRFARPTTFLLLRLSQEVLAERTFPRLALRLQLSGFDVAVSDHAGQLVWSSSTELTADTLGEPVAALFRVPLMSPRGGRMLSSRGPRRPPFVGGEAGAASLPGLWNLHARHRSGSIDGAVGRARRRNLALSLGTLGILGASLLLVASAARRAEATARQQNDFVAGLTHELHTPLAAISAAASNLADGVVTSPERTQEYGRLIRREGQRLEALVQQSLGLAGIRSAASAPRHEELDASAWLEESIAGCEWLAQERGATLTVEPLPETRLTGDRMALVQALRNIVTNALKYGPEGGTVHVESRREEGRLVVVVEDDGPGFPERDRDALLGAFVRGTGAPEQGSGLGLHFAHEIARAHGGDVLLGDRPQRRGARVSLRLPLAPAAPGKEER